MDQKSLIVLSKWLLILGGLALAFEGFMGTDLVEQVFGGLSMYIKLVAFGVPAVYLAYVMLTKKKK
jgi:uncharacterized membrane protein YuzA (DUF378 family)